MQRYALLLMCLFMIGCISPARKNAELENQVAELQSILATKENDIKHLQGLLKKKDKQIKEKEDKIKELHNKLEMFGVFEK